MTTEQNQQKRNSIRSWLGGILIVITFIATGLWEARTGSFAAADTVQGGNEWPAYGRDAGGARYSPLSQVNRGNVGQLKIAWTYRTGAEEVKAVSAGNAAFESTPILVDGLLYLTTPY
ncbi:MAG: membrane-bound PQQ-dependent dehydrogenase, glucose/quinate/shikimate family, partial [Blastocatellia bacterium]